MFTAGHITPARLFGHDYMLRMISFENVSVNLVLIVKSMDYGYIRQT